MKEVKESIMKVVFLLTACVSILAVALICIFMFAKGLPAIAEIGPADFLLGEKWKPMQNLFGILPMILGSIYVTVGAVIIGVPIAFLAAVYMAKFCNPKVYRIMKPAVGLMAGIPSIVYGFFGLVVIVPIMQDLVGGNGKSMLTASILLGIMILPTVISVAESNIRAVPDSYYEGALALGATPERSVFTAVAAGSKVRNFGRCGTGHRKSRGRDDGGDHGSGKSANYADPWVEKSDYGSAYPYLQYRYGNGICGRSAQRSVDCYSGGTVCIDFDH